MAIVRATAKELVPRVTINGKPRIEGSNAGLTWDASVPLTWDDATFTWDDTGFQQFQPVGVTAKEI